MFKTWTEHLEGDLKGKKNSFEKELNDLRNELLKKNPSLKELNKGVINLLDNDFFKKSMKECYENHRQKLEEIKNTLRDIVTRKKKSEKALREAYYNMRKVFFYSENISVNPESDSSRTDLDKIIAHYSNDVFLNDFDVSLLKKILDDIYAEVTSTGFSEKYLEDLHGELSRELKLKKYSAEIINGMPKILVELLVELLKKGFMKKDLALNSNSQIPSLDSLLQKLADMIHRSTSKWTVIGSINGVELKDTNVYKIGKVTFYDKNTYDYSKLIDAHNASFYKTEEDKNKVNGRIINFLNDKIIVDAEVDAYGVNGAKESGFLEISRAIDVLSFMRSDVMIKEPKFEEFCNFIVLNRETEALPSFLYNSDPRYVWKVKLDETIKGDLKCFNPIFNKPYNELTELEKNVANALHRYRKGNMSVDPSDKFLNYIIALESLLTTEKDRRSGKKEKISDRAICVIWILNDYREIYKDKIKKMYDYRSKIVHEGSVDIFNLEDEAKELGKITQMALRSVADKIDECETLEKFREYNEKEIHKKRKNELENARKLGIGINKEIKGEGRLKKKSGEDVGKINFKFWIKDDKKFVMTEGNIYDLKRIEEGPLSLSPSDKFIIEGKLENIEGKLVVKEMEFEFDIVIEYILHKKEMLFRVYSFDIIKPPKVASRTR
jgi:hypothetical protein